MSSTFRRIIYSGTCVCGHSWEDHHLGAVVVPEAMAVMGEWLPQECEFYGCNEDGGLDANGNDHCHNYVDADDIDQQLHNQRKFAPDESGDEE